MKLHLFLSLLLLLGVADGFAPTSSFQPPSRSIRIGLSTLSSTTATTAPVLAASAEEQENVNAETTKTTAGSMEMNVEGGTPELITALSDADAVTAEHAQKEQQQKKEELLARSLLAYRLQLERKNGVADDSASSKEQKAASKLRQEAVSRTLLGTRLAMEQRNREREVALQSRLRTETAALGLLKARLTMEQKDRDRGIAIEARLRTEADALGLLQTRLVREQKERQRQLAAQARARTEAAALGLLETRLVMEEKVRVERRKQQQVQAHQSVMQLRFELEARAKILQAQRAIELAHRALLTDRLDREGAIRAAVKARVEAQEQRAAEIALARKQPKTPEEEQALQAKYAAITDLEERAFAIKCDLGLIDITPNPSDPDYDDSMDDEIAPENVFLDFVI